MRRPGGGAGDSQVLDDRIEIVTFVRAAQQLPPESPAATLAATNHVRPQFRAELFVLRSMQDSAKSAAFWRLRLCHVARRTTVNFDDLRFLFFAGITTDSSYEWW